MAIILNEKMWAEDILLKDQLPVKGTGEVIFGIAKYYRQHLGMSPLDTRQAVTNYILERDPAASIGKWESLISRAVSSSAKYKLVELDGIPITEEEMNLVSRIRSRVEGKLAFTLLCVAKYWRLAHNTPDGWVNSTDSEIFKMAGIKPNVKTQSRLFRNLHESGLIEFSKKVDNLNVRVLFINEHSDIELVITDFRNLGNQFLEYLGEPYFRCEDCGITIKKSCNAHKYCNACAARRMVESRVNYVMKRNIPRPQ